MKKTVIAVLVGIATLAAIYVKKTPSVEILYKTPAELQDCPDTHRIGSLSQQLNLAPHLKNADIVSNRTVEINLPGHKKETGVINLVQKGADGAIRIAGSFTKGTFAYAIKDNKTITGMVFIEDEVFELPETSIDSEAFYISRNIDTVRCHKHPGDLQVLSEGAVVTGTVSVGTITATTSVPKFASKPNASHCVYLEFGGVKVQDVLWNGGKLIEATSPNYTAAQILEICKVVAERYAAFNINITTDISYYNNAKCGVRQRVIFTNNNSWLPGWGGYAYISSMRFSGTSIYSATIPCFVFTNTFGTSTKNLGECAAHEIGHTLGLAHDGTTSSAYYYGQGSWGPIMGAAYNRPIVQFSKGEYLNANNKQDDINFIISNNSTLKFSTTPTDIPTTLTAGSFITTGTISNQSDYRLYNIVTAKTGTLTVNAEPTANSAVDLQINVINKITGGTASSVNFVGLQKSSVRIPNLPFGSYNIQILPVGDGNPLSTGYTKYGSIGTFILTGSLK